MKSIVIIGSSGGNLFNLGGSDPVSLLKEIYSQCQAAKINILDTQFIAASESMDHIKPSTPTSLYYQDTQGNITAQPEDTLQAINEQAVAYDQQIADKIHHDEVAGIIAISCDPNGSNQLAIQAAIEKKIPIVGTGGTSMAFIASKGGNVVSVSGTTGTTNKTRAITFVTALAREWKIKYIPILGTTPNPNPTSAQKTLRQRANIRGIMLPALPGFIAMAIVLALSRIPGLEQLSSVFDILIKGLPIIVAVIAAKQVSDLDEVSLVAGVVAGVLSVNGGIIGGIIGGIGAGILVRSLFNLCLQWRFPITTTNIIAGGFAGLISGLIMFYLLSPIALLVGDYIKLAIEQTLAFSPLLAGLIAGLLIWPAILGGIYHAAILPLVLLEMEKTGSSFLGAVDMVGLVMVAAGINLANVIAPRDRSESAVALPGLLINLGFGTFVESAYPFMFSNKYVFSGAIVASGIGGMLLGAMYVKGTAYVPAIASPLLSNNPWGMAIAMLSIMLLSFIITLIANRVKR